MPKLIKRDRVIDDAWVIVATGTGIDELPQRQPIIVPLGLWRAERGTLRARGDVGVWLCPTDEPALVCDDVAGLPVIAVEFPKFGDGRGFSMARILRERYGFTGELRAFGDVFRDQLFFMRECGFDAFAVRGDLDPDREIVGLSVFDRVYAASTRTPQPWFRERAIAAQRHPGGRSTP